jgi:hypothetical protein
MKKLRQVEICSVCRKPMEFIGKLLFARAFACRGCNRGVVIRLDNRKKHHEATSLKDLLDRVEAAKKGSQL